MVLGDKFKNRYDEVVDENGEFVSPIDDDYGFYKYECDRRNDPLDDDYVKDEYR